MSNTNLTINKLNSSAKYKEFDMLILGILQDITTLDSRFNGAIISEHKNLELAKLETTDIYITASADLSSPFNEDNNTNGINCDFYKRSYLITVGRRANEVNNIKIKDDVSRLIEILTANPVNVETVISNKTYSTNLQKTTFSEPIITQEFESGTSPNYVTGILSITFPITIN